KVAVSGGRSKTIFAPMVAGATKRMIERGDTSARRGRALHRAGRYPALPATDGNGETGTARIVPMVVELAVEGSKVEKPVLRCAYHRRYGVATRNLPGVGEVGRDVTQ